MKPSPVVRIILILVALIGVMAICQSLPVLAGAIIVLPTFAIGGWFIGNATWEMREKKRGRR